MTTEDIIYLVNQLRGHALFHIKYCHDENCDLSVYELKIIARKLINNAIMVDNSLMRESHNLFSLVENWPS